MLVIKVGRHISLGLVCASESDVGACSDEASGLP